MKQDQYDPSEGDELPWCVRVLSRPPIELDDSMSDEALASELAERLEALLDADSCDATPEGWQKLAIALALRHEPGLKINTPADRPPRKGGREPDASVWGHLLSLNQEIRRLKAAGIKRGVVKQAAKIVRQQLGGKARNAPSVARLQNIISESKRGTFRFPRFLERIPWGRRIDRALAEATKRLEKIGE
jgi:hypothetical protein